MVRGGVRETLYEQEVNEPSGYCCAGTCRCMHGIMMRVGSLARDWQMSQQCSWFVDSLRLATPLSILEFFFLIFLPLVGCDQDWVWAGVEPR